MIGAGSDLPVGLPWPGTKHGRGGSDGHFLFWIFLEHPLS
jgi:hypothetical protein